MNSNLQFTYSDYIRIHDLVHDYKDGNEAAKVELINTFGGFIYAYMKLMTKGQYDIDNYSLRQFIGMFITNPKTKRLVNQYKFKPSVKYEIKKAVRLIVGLFSQYNEMDIQNDLIIAFFTLCNRYKDTKPTFHTYMQRYFHFAVLRYYEPLIQNASVHNLYNQDQLEDLEDVLVDDSQRIALEQAELRIDKQVCIQYTDSLKTKDNSSPLENTHFNTNWTMGITCSDLFKSLSTFERDILVLSYIKNKTDQEIADKYGVCRATINRKKKAAKQHLYSNLIKSKLNK